MSDSVRRIESLAFSFCKKLAYVKLSKDLDKIESSAFVNCRSLTSIFIPPSCTEIGGDAFNGCKKLIIFSVPQHTQLGETVILHTALYYASPFYVTPVEINFARDISNQVNDWLKNINNDEQYALHRACCSFNPIEESISRIVQREGDLDIFKRKNSIGITPSQYLEANPYAEVTEQKIINHFVLEMMGEIAL
ncbi:surface antigen BspA-like [Chaetoceros tenuissimus]|uniref:Surface antigen BspA-like n=1 Tax=Chaetoceros tenuissimus TaxID=426638 RepID=A0AAD3CEK5_9STRA|nr:surface antigen BspA-like [Chaetoceros tenuissimus]